MKLLKLTLKAKNSCRIFLSKHFQNVVQKLDDKLFKRPVKIGWKQFFSCCRL